MNMEFWFSVDVLYSQALCTGEDSLVQSPLSLQSVSLSSSVLGKVGHVRFNLSGNLETPRRPVPRMVDASVYLFNYLRH